MAVLVLALVATVTVVAGLSARFGLNGPIVLTVTGVVVSFLPGVPALRVEPSVGSEIVLLGFLPPLLYSAAIHSSLVDFKANRRAIGLLSVGLVIATALCVGVVAMWVLHVRFAVGFALGAIVGPPDAVSTTAIARRIGLPRRVVTVLEGESLLNDATALVCLRTAIAAIGGTVSARSIAGSFAFSLVGGLVVGVLVAYVVGLIRKHVTDSVVDTALSFMTPFIAYLPAESIHASGVLAVVVAGLLLAHQAPVLQTASSRLSERINWSTISFLLENSVFLLIGLQVRWIIAGAADSSLGLARVIAFCAAVLVTVILIRPLWVFPVRYLLLRPGPDGGRSASPWTWTAILSWAGTRGVVTLAAAFILPAGTPFRSVLLLAALVVVAGTLLQGLTLPTLARGLDVRGPDPREDALQEATLLQTAVNAGLAEIERIRDDAGEDVVQTLRQRADSRTHRVWERLGSDDGGETPSQAYRRLRMQMLRAERAEVLRIRDQGVADHVVLGAVMSALDLEESMLDRSAERPERLRDEPLEATVLTSQGCEHLRTAPRDAEPTTPEGCTGCLDEGTSWVHLRMCLTCGYVGCCDSSVRRHADAHYHQSSHPVMRSFEPGEAWRWCYVDELTG